MLTYCDVSLSIPYAILAEYRLIGYYLFFFFNDPATTEIYTFPTRRSSDLGKVTPARCRYWRVVAMLRWPATTRDRKSTRLNSSHQIISYAVFCLKKKNARILGAMLAEGDAIVHQ